VTLSSSHPLKRALVTGGAGFIGHHLCAALARQNAMVYALDDLSTGRRELLAGLPDSVEFVQLDVREHDELARLLHCIEPDVVFHLAGLHFIPHCNRDPLATLQINTVGTASLVEAIRARPSVRRLVFSSSAAVYAPDSIVCRETDPPAPDDVYGETKLFAENIIARFARETGTSAIVLRLFNVYGPGETNAHVIPEILDQACRGDTIALGNLSPRRDYIFIDDVVEALLRAGSAASLEHAVLNIGTGHDHSVADVVATLAYLIGRPLRAESHPSRTRRTDRPRLRADTSFARAMIGWTAKFDLARGLQRTWSHWQRNEP
jgi:UDP-glucose 4-epimerase